jgi:glycine cleavage system H lipoate-binding protein
MNGTVRVGLDDFVRKIIKNIDEVELPKLDKNIQKGELLFSLRHDSYTINVSSPISGKVTLLNTEHVEHPEWIASKPFELSWMCCIDPSNLAEELPSLKIGADSINWYKGEIDKYNEITRRVEKNRLPLDSSRQGSDKAEKQKTAETFFQEFAKAFPLG